MGKIIDTIIGGIVIIFLVGLIGSILDPDSDESSSDKVENFKENMYLPVTLKTHQ